MFPKALTVFSAFLFSMTAAHSEEVTSSPQAPINSIVLQSVASMPAGGGYSAGSTATHALYRAVVTTNGSLGVEPSLAIPSYCSGATYLVFLKVLATLQSEHRLSLTPAVTAELRPSGQPDGTGIWGRWNANGPGTARLFYEFDLGPNFTELSKALPGDFLKIFWNDGIGASEHGHSVIYLGSETRNGIETLSFWSSNIPGGFGRKTVPLSRIHRMVFSRLEQPENLARVFSLPRSDSYLASLERRSCTIAEMDRRCGLIR
jgi:hypothetical protein